MWRGELSLIVVLVLGVIAADASAELVAHYPFDDGTANDKAYYYEDADGTFFGDAKVINDPGRGAVLDLDGTGDYVKVLNNQVAEFSTESFTYAFWAKTNFTGDWYCFWKGKNVGGQSGENDDLHGVNCYHDNDSTWARFTIYNYDGLPGWSDDDKKSRTDVPDTNVITDQWVHVTCVRDASVNELRFYINGELEPPGPTGINPAPDNVRDISNTGNLYIGANDRGDPEPTPSTFWNGQIDDFRVYNHALSEKEVERLANDYVDPNLASDPSPQDGAENECTDLVLEWAAGDNAVTHDVYFGTDGGDVRDANTLDAEFRINQPGTTYNAGLLESPQPGETYFWRIDEVNPGHPDSRWKGNVWKFRINDGKTHSPAPADDAKMVGVEQILSWGAGCHAASHDVYFGTDFDDVSDGATVAYQGNQGIEDTDFDPHDWDPCGLAYSTWYYWRIDEVNDSNTWEGEVWSFRTGSPIFDPNLRVWYKFDETAGSDAPDSSGREYDGIVYGEGSWDANGYYDGCISFEDNGNVVVPMGVLEEIGRQITITVWINNATSEDDDNVICAAGWGEELPYMRVSVPDEDHDVSWRAGNDTNDSMTWDGGNPAAWKDSWNHFAFVKNEDQGKMQIYLNGLPAAESTIASSGTLAGMRDQRFKIAAETQDSSGYEGRIDEFRVYDRALSADEIAAIFRGGDLGIAWGPDPYDGQADVARDANLAWRSGDYAVQHKVYFGTSWEDVNSMSDPCATKNPGDENYNPGVLELDTSYYWRIDEVNGPNTWKGPVWRFTVADFIILDDFEQYDLDQKSVQYTWYDQYSQEWGEVTGAWLELVRPPKPVHVGDQAVSYTYDTDDPWADLDYAEAWLPLEEIGGQQNWREAGVTLLRLFFYGDSANDTTDAEQMYVGVDDTDGAYAEMRYGDNAGEDMN
ncbi:MAG TPA: LamG domain-containing protein, partial [Sedimentisphaerales bacterium]|nr:LamG domain-containing protein [Sedimentisphaerales bacterium]